MRVRSPRIGGIAAPIASLVALTALGAAPGCTLDADPPREPDSVASTAAAVEDPGKGFEAEGFSFQGDTSGALLRLDRLFYDHGQEAKASLIVERGSLVADKVAVALVAPDSGDVELMLLKEVETGKRYTSVDSVPLAVDDGKANPLDGKLTTKKGGMVFAMYYPDYDKETKLEGKAAIVFDWGVIAPEEPDSLQPKVNAKLALTKDEVEPVKGAKPVGTLVGEKGLPVQLATRELVVYPEHEAELERFLKETKGKIVAVQGEPKAQDGKPAAYLVQVDPKTAPQDRFAAMQILMGKSERVHGSSSEAIQMLAAAMYYRLQGYHVAVNPRVQLHSSPAMTEGPGFSEPDAHTHADFAVDHARAYSSLWDYDDARVRVAFIDMGFAPNPDYRGYPDDIHQCDLAGSNLVDGIMRGMRCADHAAEGPPTVGASFFGDPVWHGNLTVTTAGGVTNNGYGANGVAGQVMQPMLYRMDLGAYAFEMGLGIEQAVLDGASVVNVSAGYPCRLVNTLGIDAGICSVSERARFCGGVTAGLAGAAAAVCALVPIIAAIPIVGPLLVIPAQAACGAAMALTVAASGTCFSTLVAGDLRGAMRRGVDVATEHGVPVVASSGNVLDLDLPDVFDDLLDVTNHNASDWQMIPCTIDNVICVGSADVASPHANLHFNGPAVDIWAPGSGTYASPARTDRLYPVADHVLSTGGGTSSAAAYISGTIALMQALNPDLDPAHTSRTGADLRDIPDDVLGHLHLWAHGPSGDRGDLVDPFSTMQWVSAAEVLPFTIAGYDDSLNYTASESANVGDYASSAVSLGTLSSMRSTTDTIHFIPAVPAGVPGFHGARSTDTDHYTMTVPPTPGIYSVRLDVLVPAGHGALAIDGDLLQPAGTSTAGMDEIRSFTTPQLFNGAEVAFSIGHGMGSGDNPYIIRAPAATWVAEAADPDRFDVNDSTVNPAQSRPDNDDPSRAAPLGTSHPAPIGDTLDWQPVGSSSSRFEIELTDLNFHDLADVDYYALEAFPGFSPGTSPNCLPRLRIESDANVEIIVSNEWGVLHRGYSPLLVDPAALFSPPLIVEVRSLDEGVYVEYDLRFSFDRSRPAICDMDPQIMRPPEDIFGMRAIDFPRLLPSPEEIRGPYVDQFINWNRDPAGRLMDADFYRVAWDGGDVFRLFAELENTKSLAIALVNAQGEVIKSVSTPDLDQQNGLVDAGIEGGLLLEVPKLAKGEYFVRLSDGFPGSRIRMFLSQGAVHNGTATVESRLGLPMAPSFPNGQ